MNKHVSSKVESIVVYTTNTRYTWLKDWTLCHGMAAVDALLKAANIENNWQGKPCYQTAAVVPEYPDTPVVFTNGSYVTSTGYTHFRETLGLSNKFWIRFGIAASNTAGVSLGAANANLELAWTTRGSECGRGKVVINPGQISGTDINYFEIGAFIPTISFDKVMAAIVVMNNESTYLEYQLVCRTAKDRRAPNAWQTCEAGWDNPAAGNSVRNTTALSAPAGANVTTNFWVQFGIAVRKKSGAAGNPMAELHVAIAASVS